MVRENAIAFSNLSRCAPKAEGSEITVYLIEAANLDFGWELSAAVEQAVNQVVMELEKKIAELDKY